MYENGFFEFQTDAPFDPANQATWPTAYNQQKPATVTYRSQEIGMFAQNDWRLGNRIRLNAGLRYDIDLNLRLNDFYRQALDDPELPGPRPLHQPRSRHRHEQRPAAARRDVGQPRGRHADRPRRLGRVRHAEPPWFQIRSMNQFASSAVRITDPARLQNFPDTNAVLGGRSLDRVPGRRRRAAARHRDSGRFRPALRVEHDDRHRMAGESDDDARRRLHPFVCEPSDRLDRREPSAERRGHRRQSASGRELQPGDDGRELHRELVRRRRNAVAIADRVARFVAGVLHAVAQLPRWRRLLHDACEGRSGRRTSAATTRRTSATT